MYMYIYMYIYIYVCTVHVYDTFKGAYALCNILLEFQISNEFLKTMSDLQYLP